MHNGQHKDTCFLNTELKAERGPHAIFQHMPCCQCLGEKTEQNCLGQLLLLPQCHAIQGRNVFVSFAS